MKVLTIAGSSLRLMMRDRTTVFFTVLFPFMIILVIGTATAGLGESRVPVGIVHEGAGEFSDALADALGDSRALRLQPFTDIDSLRRAARRGVVTAGVVIPSGYDEAVRSGRQARVLFVSDLGRGFPGLARATVAAAVADQGGRLQAARFAARAAGGDFRAHLREAARVEGLVDEVEVRTDEVGERARTRFIMSGFEYTAPSNFTLFVFITSLAASAQLIASRRLGVARRMLGTPTSAGTIIAGEGLGRFAVALFQGLYIVVLGLVVFGVDWGDPLAAVLLATLFVLVATSVALFFGTIFRTPEQAGSIGVPAGIAMGMLAGCMWPRFIMPMPMQRLGQAFPHAWAMDAWIKLIARGAGLRDILPELAVLAGFVVVLLPLAAWRLRRSIVAG